MTRCSCVITEKNALIVPTHKVEKDSRMVRMILMMIMVIAYMFAELGVGIYGNSLTLVGDSFHMVSDAAALVIGYVSIQLGKRKASSNLTFGYKRAEILGAFFNSSFLISTAFFLLTEIIQKFIDPTPITDIDLVLYTAIGGLVVNIVGMFLFGHAGHDHSHGGHSHGHGHSHSHDHGHDEEHHNHDHTAHHGHSHEHDHNVEEECHHEHDHHDHDHNEHGHEHEHFHGDHNDHEEHHHCDDHEHDHHEHSQEHDIQIVDVEKQETKQKPQKKKQKKDMAMHGVFLHVLGDFVGSIIVIIAALAQKFGSKLKGIEYIDPACSLIMVGILINSGIPLVKESGKILMMSTEIKSEELKKQIMMVKYVVGLHELHCWSFTPDKFIGHVHVLMRQNNISEYNNMVNDVKEVFHAHSVHSVTVGVEFVEESEKDLDACFVKVGCKDFSHRCCEDQIQKIQ